MGECGVGERRHIHMLVRALVSLAAGAGAISQAPSTSTHINTHKKGLWVNSRGLYW